MDGSNVTMLIGGRGDGDDFEPPADEVPGLVPGPPFVAGGASAAVAVARLRAYSSGLEIALEVHFNAPDTPSGAREELNRLIRADRSPGPNRLHLALHHPDGGTVRNNGPQEPGRVSALLLLGASSHGPLWRLRYWARPLPATGATVSVRWPGEGISDAAFAVSPAAVAQAAARIHRLWTAPGPVVGGALGSP